MIEMRLSNPESPVNCGTSLGSMPPPLEGPYEAAYDGCPPSRWLADLNCRL